jgi:hypothetical protein
LLRINACHFTYELWRNGYIDDLNLQCRYHDITSNRGKDILRKFTVGFCEGEKLYFRPKRKHYAIMIFKNGIHFWFHIRNNEFEKVFKDET